MFRFRGGKADNASQHLISEPSSEAQSPDSLGLDHLNHVQRVGLRDDVLSGFYNNSTNEVFRGFSLTPQDILVDVGTGSGGPLGFCVSRVAEVVAIDSDPTALENSRSNNDLRDAKNIRFLLASSERIPLPDGFANKVMCLEMLEHVGEPELAAAELHRVGQPGCRYLISVPDPRSERILQQVAPKSYFERPHHINIFEPNAFRSLLSNAGLNVLSHDFVGGYSSVFTALYFSRTSRLGLSGQSAINSEIAHSDVVLDEWASTWNRMLDSTYGIHIKEMFDSVLPKSQVIVAEKPLAGS